MRLRLHTAIQRSLTDRPAFDADLYAELRAKMRHDRNGTSPTRSAAAVKREADRRARERAVVLAKAAAMRGVL